MATFHFPTRAADPTGFTIANLESRPSSREVVPLQAIRFTAGGQIEVDKLAENGIQFVDLSIELLSSADKDTLHTFFTSTTEFANLPFDFTDDLDTDFNTCHFVNPSVNFLRVSNNSDGQFSERLLFRVDPA